MRRRGRVACVALALATATLTSSLPVAAAPTAGRTRLAPAAPRTPNGAVAAGIAARPSQTGVGEEQAFVTRINELRTSRGLVPLQVDGELQTQARIWADTMMRRGDIFHSQTLASGITADWQKLGENVGVGPTVDELFDAFVASPRHFENLVDPKYRYIGVGVVWAGEDMFTAHRFMATFPPTQASPAPAPTAPAPIPERNVSPASAPPAPPTTIPEELAATDLPPAAAAPAAAATAPSTSIPPAKPERVTLVLRALDMASI